MKTQKKRKIRKMDNSGLGNSIIEMEGFGGGQIEEINNYNALQDALIRESHEDRSEFSTPECTCTRLDV